MAPACLARWSPAPMPGIYSFAFFKDLHLAVSHLPPIPLCLILPHVGGGSGGVLCNWKILIDQIALPFQQMRWISV